MDIRDSVIGGWECFVNMRNASVIVLMAGCDG